MCVYVYIVYKLANLNNNDLVSSFVVTGQTVAQIKTFTPILFSTQLGKLTRKTGGAI